MVLFWGFFFLGGAGYITTAAAGNDPLHANRECRKPCMLSTRAICIENGIDPGPEDGRKINIACLKLIANDPRYVNTKVALQHCWDRCDQQHPRPR